jgi:diguanylate cyclase (GGDEF)-like protein/PAS domain S-box-containing protein
MPDHVNASVDNRDDLPTLLIVDDEPRLLASLLELMRDCGLNIRTAGSGNEAIAQLSTIPIDVVLLDLYLPDLSGHGVMDHIKRHGIDTHVVVMSGGVWIEDVVGAIRGGAHDYLRKPHSREALFKTVSDTLEQRRVQQRKEGKAIRLQASEKMHRHLVNSSPDLIYTLDHDGRFTFVNDRVGDLLGYRQEELLGRTYSVLVNDKDAEQARHVLNERRIDERASRDVEMRLKRRVSDDHATHLHPHLVPTLVTSTGMYGSAENSEKQRFIGSRGVVRDATDRQRAAELIFHQAYHDALTDLPNRILFMDRLGMAMIQARRNETELAVIFIDLDRFKLVNDTLGHARGDELLRQAAKRMSTCLRKGDTLSRHGGDEFVAVLSELREQNDAVVVAEKFLACLNAPFALGEHVAHISASIGISIYPRHGNSIEELLHHADAAMYEVKSQGRNGRVLYSPSIQDALDQKLALRADLSMALENNEFEMYYQAKVDAASGQIVGAEALMRWNHPTRGVMLPGEFLPLAEESGLMRSISTWTIDVLCRDMRKWNGHGERHLTLSLNLSPRYLDYSGFCQEVEAALLYHDIAPDLLEIEIAETSCIGDPHRVIDQLGRLSRLGVSLAIDDFGTGHSSLAYLRQFPVRTIKIDRSFTRQIRDKNQRYPVVLAIISIARGLKLKLVAEGVESEAQAEYLRENGCPIMQGFLFHRPMPLDRFIRSLD